MENTGNFIKSVINEIQSQGSNNYLPDKKQAISEYIKNELGHIEIDKRNPVPFFSLGFLFFLQGDPYTSLHYYTKAVHLSDKNTLLLEHYEYFQKSRVIEAYFQGYSWIEKYLVVALRGKFPENTIPFDAPVTGKGNISAPVVIVSGGCDKCVEETIKEYKQLLIDIFSSYHGTIISGGTRAGIAGLAGDIQEFYKDSLYTIGYVPGTISDNEIIDERYKEIRKSEGKGFSPCEPLQSWIDILASGIKPGKIKLVGINGGKISACEFRIALSIGASVAIIKNSGREADMLLQDPLWNYTGNLYAVDISKKDLVKFITG